MSETAALIEEYHQHIVRSNEIAAELCRRADEGDEKAWEWRYVS